MVHYSEMIVVIYCCIIFIYSNEQQRHLGLAWHMLLLGLHVCGMVFMLFLLLDILLCCDTNVPELQRQSKHNCLLSHFVSIYTAAAETCNSVYRNKVIVNL